MSAPEPACPFGAALPTGRHGAPIDTPVQTVNSRYSLVQLSARRAQSDTLTSAIRTAFGLDLPPPGRTATAGELTVLWMQPSAWLLMAPLSEPGVLARRVKDACGEMGSAVDQTQGRAVLRLSGDKARDVLARICRLDLHPRAFHAGSVAATPIAELHGLLYQCDDTPTFEMIVAASCAGWFAEAVRRAAMSVGYEIA